MRTKVFGLEWSKLHKIVARKELEVALAIAQYQHSEAELRYEEALVALHNYCSPKEKLEHPECERRLRAGISQRLADAVDEILEARLRCRSPRKCCCACENAKN